MTKVHLGGNPVWMHGNTLWRMLSTPTARGKK